VNHRRGAVGSLGRSYEPEVVLDVLDHLALYWSSPAAGEESAAPQGKSRLTVTYGFDGGRRAGSHR